ncbi:GNAT family N-acetyltransferase [bacterium]|nr:GNAT family N-acetyltransferase [bacterium]
MTTARAAAEDIRFQSVAPENRPDALLQLLAPFPEDERIQRRDATLAAVEAGTLSLDGLRQAWWGAQPVGIFLTMQQPDHVTLVWPPVIAPSAELSREDIEQACWGDICEVLDHDGSRLGQVLLDASEADLAESLMPWGFHWQTELFFLARTFTEPWTESPEPAWSVESYSSATHARFAQLIESTYQDSLDCRILEGIRTGEEALASHKLSGEHRPDLWQIFTIDGRDAALLLLSEHASQDAVELVYFGVAPEFRGQGLGRAVIQRALSTSRNTGRAAIFLAVDAGNGYANTLYATFDFAELARRRACFRPRGGAAHKSSTGS